MQTDVRNTLSTTQMNVELPGNVAEIAESSCWLKTSAGVLPVRMTRYILSRSVDGPTSTPVMGTICSEDGTSCDNGAGSLRLSSLALKATLEEFAVAGYPML